MKNNKRFISLLLAVLMVVSLGISSSAHTFTDVTAYSEAIGALSDIGVITGYSATKFGPNVNVTRWQMALLISRLVSGNVDAEQTHWNKVTNDFPFTDIDTGSQYPTAIKYASDNGIIKGITPTTFNPTRGITLREGLTMGVRALGYPAADYDANWPTNYILKASTLGLLTDLENMSFTQTMTRGQTAQLLYNMLYAKKYDGTTLASTLVTGEKLVLVATENKRLNESYSYARAGRYVFAPVNDNGTLGEAVTIDASLVGIRDADNKIGYCYDIMSTNNYSNITKCVECTAVTYQSGISVTATQGLIKIGSTTYYVAKTLFQTSGSRYDNIVINGMGSAYTRDTVLTASDIEGTTAYFTMTCFDDNGDGDYERAVYVPYVFGQYVVDAQGRVSIAGNQYASALRFKNITPANGDYIVYSYDAQTGTLDVGKKFTPASGMLTNLSGGVATIGGTRYNVGNEECMNAGASTMSSLSSYVGRTITFVSDGNTLLAYETPTTSGTTTTVGDPLATTSVGVVTAIDTTGVTLGTLTGSGTLSHSQILTVDGASYTGYASSIFGGTSSQLAVGDVVTFTQYMSSGYTIDHIKTPTFVTSSTTQLGYSNNYFTIYGSTSSAGGTAGAVSQLFYTASSTTPVYMYSSSGLGGATMQTGTVSQVNNMQLQSGYAIFVVYSNATSGMISSQTANAIIIVPYDSTKMSLTPTFTTGTGTNTGTGTGIIGGTQTGTADFDSVVYICNPTVTNSGSTYTVSATDLAGSTTTVTYTQTGFFSPTFTTGYYLVKNGVIVTGPVSASQTVSTTTGAVFYKGATVGNVTASSSILGGSGYSMTLNGQTSQVSVLPTFSALYSGSLLTSLSSAMVVGSGYTYTADIFVSGSTTIMVLHDAQNPWLNQQYPGGYPFS